MSALEGCCVDFYQLPLAGYLLGESFHPGGLKLTRQLAQQLLIHRGSRVLDIASGRGASSLFLSDHYGCEQIALDLASENLKLTQQKARKNETSSQLHAVQANAEQLPFEDSCFDAVICECALCTFDQSKSVLSEIKRVLKPGGRLGLSDVVLNQPLPEALNNLLSRVFCISGARTTQEYGDMIADVGLIMLQQRRVDWVISEMAEQISQRATLLKSLSGEQEVIVPDWISDNPSLLENIKYFIKSDGLGYVLMSARKSS